MNATTRFRAILGGFVAVIAVAGTAVAQTPSPVPTAGHAAVGSWFGPAIQLCPSGVAPSACKGGNPAIALIMTPTLVSDGIFLGNDTLTLGAAPFGPHTVAHGQWIATSATEFVVDYTFMLNEYPPQGDGAITALSFRWAGQVLDKNTLIGYVNAYFSDPIPQTWQPLFENEFPRFPSAASVVVTAPATFIKDPSTCRTEKCPLGFKFLVKRVAP